MFEINLVPDVKAEMLHKQRMANFVLFICIIVAAAAAGVVLMLGSVVAGQNLSIASQQTEIGCRSTGIVPKGNNGKCITDHGTAVLEFANLNELLTIQDQMSRLNTLNTNKKLLSRVFSVLDILLPVGEETVEITELNIDLTNGTLNFDATGSSESKIGYKALEVFLKSASRTYFDHGRYYRKDPETNQDIVIPTMCITETTVNGILKGIYHKGKQGCETPLIPETATEGGEEETAADETENPDTEAEAVAIEVIDIPIQRGFATQSERDAYIQSNQENGGGYYFKSSCLVYGEEGTFDEDKTLETCPLLAASITIPESNYGRDANNELALRFSANIQIKADVFQFAKKHMLLVGPSRQNVTDSYTQIRDMFSEELSDCDPNDTECMDMEENNNGA